MSKLEDGAVSKVYVASSWRNPDHSAVVAKIRACCHEVYDFKNPAPGVTGFSWAEIDPNWKSWNESAYIRALHHPVAKEGFYRDFDAMEQASVCVLLLPCGRSAHTEAGYMKGAGKKVFVLLTKPEEPELMYKIYDAIFENIHDLIYALGRTR